MSRPSHSIQGFRRRVQMSRHALHIIVEGKDYDSSYYGRIAEGSSTVRRLGYEVTKIETLNIGGGKKSVLKLFESIKRSGHLTQHVSTGRRVMVFMLDRDAERVIGGSKRSRHIFYTKNYDVEADIIMHGDDAEAISCATSLSPSDARVVASNIAGWPNAAATTWREWITLCCISHHLAIPCSVTFKSPSRINSSKFGPVDTGKRDSHRNEMISRSALSVEEFGKLEIHIRSKIDSLYRRSEGHRIVKGKWLPSYLSFILGRMTVGGTSVNTKDLEKRIVSNYVGSLDVSRSWARPYLEGFENLLTS